MVNNRSTVTLEFEISHVHNKSMSMSIGTPQGTEYFDQIVERRFKHTVDIEFPTTITIVVSGKGMNDTVIDSDGNIIDDMYIKLNKVLVDGIPCSANYVYDLINCTNDGATVQTNYWGMNGTIKLDFLYKNVVFWAMTHSHRF